MFGKPLRAFYTKHNTERVVWQRFNSGMVIVRRIGQSACLLPKSAMIGYGRASETERVLVGYEDLINLNRLKIQSNPLGKLSGNHYWLRIMSGMGGLNLRIIIRLIRAKKQYAIVKRPLTIENHLSRRKFCPRLTASDSYLL